MEVLKEMLELSDYDSGETDYLLNGFSQGFDLEYAGDWCHRDTSNNLPFRDGVGSPVELWNKMIKEVRLGRFAGPYTRIPFANFVQSPIGLVPKSNGETRLNFSFVL